MTISADGSRRYSDEMRFKTITAQEFVRRFRHAVTRQETAFAWLIGAGCSVTSGIPTADDAVRMWLKDLKYLETGQEADLEGWAAKRFVGYDPDHPGKVYGEVLQALFHTDTHRRRELERMMKAAEPGFGYATMAQLMTHQKWGAHSSLTISINFDDLAADALHLYSQRRPQVFTPESLSHRTPISPSAPTVVKIYGDAHLPRLEGPGGSNRPQLSIEVTERLSELLSETGLIIVGYGGRDESVLDMLESLPGGEPSGGVYWVNAQAPTGAMGDWLDSRGGVWVEHGDFDELMYYVRLEFGLGHPKIERFERILRNYEAKYRELSTRSGIGLSDTPGDDGDGASFGLNAPKTLSSRRETGESRRRRLRESLDAFAKVAAGPAPDGNAASEDASPATDPAAAANEPQVEQTAQVSEQEAATEVEAGAKATAANEAEAGVAETPPVSDDASAVPMSESMRASGAAMRARRRALRQADRSGAASPPPGSEPPRDVGALFDAAARELRGGRGGRGGGRGSRAPEQSDADQESVEEVLAKLGDDADRPAAVPAPAPSAGAGGAARDKLSLPPEPLVRLDPEAGRVGEAAFAAALEARPDDAALHARFARFLSIGVSDAERAERAFETAVELEPDNVVALRDYALFAIERLHDATRAEKLLTKALNLDLRNAETLRALANFLLRARGDLDEAENCYRLAIEVAGNAPDNLVAYARFLEERRGRREAAEAYLRRAAEQTPPDAVALAEMAIFRTAQAQNFESASELLVKAETLDPSSAVVAFAQAALAERIGDLDSAERAFLRAIDLDPREMRPQLGYAAYLRHRRGDLEAADAQHRNAISALPNAAEPLSVYAMYLEEVRGDAVEAERHHRAAIELEPYNPIVLAAFAEHLGRRSQMTQEADDLFRDALRLSPRSAAILRAYGRFLDRAKGDADGAETYLRRAVEMDPHGVEALDDLAQFLHTVRADAEEAEVYFREALRLAPDRAETLNRFAVFLRDSRNNLDEAERCYQRALERNPKDAATLSRTAQFLLSQGRNGEGLKLLNEAFDAAWSMDPSVRPAWLMLELWIYRYAHDSGRREESLKAARKLIKAGVRSEGWDLGPTVDQAIAAGHPKPDLLNALARVATAGADPSELELYL
ncbi:MAG: tetratricopeptide repeat protein [Rhodobacteraceae bacterium]|nr:tetratricopeptide repeat protein [Paracoccaceae bacterium]